MKYWDDEHIQIKDFCVGEMALPMSGMPARRGMLVEYDIPKELIEVEIIPNSEQDADISNTLTGDVVRMYCVRVETRSRRLEYGAPLRTRTELVPFASLRLSSIPTGWKTDPIDAYARAMSIV